MRRADPDVAPALRHRDATVARVSRDRDHAVRGRDLGVRSCRGGVAIPPSRRGTLNSLNIRAAFAAGAAAR